MASVKGSPGVTTVALALASWWPRPVVVLEADPAGGDLAVRLGLPEDPGLVGLAAALRRHSQADLLEHYAQESPLGIPVVPAPAGARQSAASVSLLAALPGAPLDVRGGRAPRRGAPGPLLAGPAVGHRGRTLSSGSAGPSWATWPTCRLPWSTGGAAPPSPSCSAVPGPTRPTRWRPHWE